MAQTAPTYLKEYQERKYMTEENTSEPFTKFSNAFLDEHLSQIEYVTELKVTIAIIRKTIGFGKKSDIISFSQFEKLTGLSRPSVNDGLNYALARGLVTREKSGQYWSYSFQVVAQGYQLNEATSSPGLPEPVASGYQQVVASGYTQKKGLNKTLKKLTTPKGVVAPPPENDFEVVAFYQPGQEPQPPEQEQLPMPSSRLVEAAKPGPATARGRVGAGGEGGGSVHIPAKPHLDLAHEVKGFEAEGGGRDMTSSSKAAPEPKPRAKKQPRKVPIYPDDPPVIVLYKQKANYEPNPNQTEKLIKKALDLDRLDEILDWWLGCGYKVNNVQGVLDRYSKGVPVYELRAGTPRNDRGTGMGGPGSRGPQAAHPAAPDSEYFNRVASQDIKPSWNEVLRH